MIENMNSIRLKINELLTYHCSCLGNLVIIVADAYCPKEIDSKYELNTTKDKRINDTSL